MDFTPTPIRRRPDGSIDTDWHIQQGRRLRAEQARRIAVSSGNKPARRWFFRLLPMRSVLIKARIFG